MMRLQTTGDSRASDLARIHALRLIRTSLCSTLRSAAFVRSMYRSYRLQARCGLFAQLLVLFACVSFAGSSVAKDDFLAPEQAYKYSTRIDGNQLIVAWRIEKGYYLYKKKMAIASKTDSVQLGTPAWPK